MTKKTSREILVDENQKFFGKGKISHRVGNASLPQGAMDAPCTLAHLPDNVSLLVLKPHYHKILRVHGYGRRSSSSPTAPDSVSRQPDCCQPRTAWSLPVPSSADTDNRY